MRKNHLDHRERVCAICKKKKTVHHFIGRGQDYLNCQSCRAFKKKKRDKAREQFLKEGRIHVDRL
ncbi:hypothetical protein [Halobacillus sp. A5]|uniref:hypothetical protein n=1 Tax=Halobacillus sp. A5 TaxID=2880263 RepID=UPI0020A69E77|nr:hypothetical protein [Halobacillus sp. A5]MCP3027744.1 hypothetical protein [Halobacillus sp. A5]